MPSAGALSYLTVRPPESLSYGAPAVDMSWLSQLPQSYQQGQQYARLRSLQAPILDEQGQPSTDFGTITRGLLQRGGGETAEKLLPTLLKQEYLKQFSPQGQGQTGTSDIYGSILQQESSNRDNIATSNKGAVGPGQIIPSTWAQYARPGEDIRDPAANRAVSRRILDDYMQRYNGDAARAAVAYFSGPGNVAPPGSPTPWKVNKSDGGTTTSEYVRQVMGRIRTGQQTADAGGGAGAVMNAPAPVEQPPGAMGTPPFMGGAETGGTGPAASNVGSGPANIQLASTSPTLPNMGGPQAQQAAVGAPTQVAQAAPAAPGETSPAMALVPKGIRDPRAYADALEKSANGDLERAKQEARLAGVMGVPYQAGQAELQARQKFDLAKQIRESLAKEAQTKLETGQAVEKKGAELDLERGQKAYEGIHGQAITYQQEQKPFNDLARSILNDPNMYSGIGAERKLDLEKIASNIFGGDHTKAAALMEGLQKVTASSMLQQMNATREQMIAAGSNAGRMFKDQTEAVKQASPQLSTTKTGNRFLVEVQDRNGRLATKVDDMMQDYLAKHNLRYPDRGFDRELTAHLKANAIFTKEELAHPSYLGAPSMPEEIYRMPKAQAHAAYVQWGSSLGLSPGDPVRMPNGEYILMPGR